LMMLLLVELWKNLSYPFVRPSLLLNGGGAWFLVQESGDVELFLEFEWSQRSFQRQLLGCHGSSTFLRTENTMLVNSRDDMRDLFLPDIKQKFRGNFFNFFSLFWRGGTPQNQVFSRCLKNGDFLPNRHIRYMYVRGQGSRGSIVVVF
jgi:hypothetical protein